MSTATKTKPAVADRGSGSPRGGRPAGTGGKRLQEAFESVSDIPVFAEARRRLMSACATESSTTADLVEMGESDAALAIVLVRAANNGGGHGGGATGVVDAIEALEPAGVTATVAPLQTYDLLEQPGAWAQDHDRFRRHGLAVRHAAERIAALVRLPNHDQIAFAALVHDIGRLVLVQLHGPEHGPGVAGYAPEERVRRERVELGIDHAIVGGVLLRRWGLPDEIAGPVERHHAPDADGAAAAIRLADLVVHHCSGNRVSGEAMRAAAASLEITDEQLRSLIFEHPHFGSTRRPSSEPCPLSRRELDALRGLAQGKVYKQIARELGLSVSTVRTHLHNVYRKIGAVDRAQAVLLARDRGWI